MKKTVISWNMLHDFRCPLKEQKLFLHNCLIFLLSTKQWSQMSVRRVKYEQSQIIKCNKAGNANTWRKSNFARGKREVVYIFWTSAINVYKFVLMFAPGSRGSIKSCQKHATMQTSTVVNACNRNMSRIRKQTVRGIAGG